MNAEDYDHFYGLTRRRSGLVLSADKRYLIDGRLQGIAASEGFATVGALLLQLRLGASEALIRRCVDAMATHETSFFRDRSLFDHVNDTVIPAMLVQNAKKRSLRIWSAACSTGQEPYSLAMMLHRHRAALAGWHIEIVASDLTEDSLVQARAGHYSAFELQRGLTPAQIEQHFRRIDDRTWEIQPHLKTWISVRTFNLLDRYATLGQFDMVFCRNVLIYLDRAVKIDILKKMHGVLVREGYLVLGSAETVVGLSADFDVLKDKHGIYRPKSAATSEPVPI